MRSLFVFVLFCFFFSVLFFSFPFLSFPFLSFLFFLVISADIDPMWGGNSRGTEAAAQAETQAKGKEKNIKEKFMLFSDHNRSLLRRQPGPNRQNTNLVRVNNEVGLHVLLLHFASLHQVSHTRGVPPTPLPQDHVQGTQQGPDVVLHDATNLLSEQNRKAKYCTIWGQLDGKPSVTPGSPGIS